MPSRGLGYRPDPFDPRDWDVDKAQLRAPSGVAAAVSLARPRTYDQRSSSSCVGQGVAGAVHIVELEIANALGLPMPEGPSAMYIYAYARLQHSNVLLDLGTHVRSAAEACRKLGVPDEKYWPFSTRPWRINRRPSFEAHMHAEPRHGLEYYRIRAGGDERVQAIRSALSDGYPVVFGTRVDESFLESRGSDIIDIPNGASPIAGGHAMVISGYQDGPSGTIFEIRNSWGPDWRHNGYAYLTEEYIRWPHTRDFTIFRGWKRLQQLRESLS